MKSNENAEKHAYLHTVDMCVLFYCRESQEIKVLLNKRERDPFSGHWALPGVVVNGDAEDRSLNDAVSRLCKSAKIGFPISYIEQVGTVGDAFRDPRCWSSSTIYLGIQAEAAELTEGQRLFSFRGVVDGSIKLPFDHNQLVAMVHDRLFSKSLYSSLPLMFLSSEFSAPEATSVFSVVLERQVLKTSIRQRLLKMVDAQHIRETGRKKAGDGGRPQGTYEHLAQTPYFFDRSFME